MENIFILDDLKQPRGLYKKDRAYIVRATGGRYTGVDLNHAKAYAGITAIFSIKQWGTRGYK